MRASVSSKSPGRRRDVHRIHQHHLHDEVKLAERRGRFLDAEDVRFQQKRCVIHQFEADLAVGAENGAVQIKLLTCSEHDVHGRSPKPVADDRANVGDAA